MQLILSLPPWLLASPTSCSTIASRVTDVYKRQSLTCRHIFWRTPMKKILLLNGGKQFAHSDGQYNATPVSYTHLDVYKRQE